MSGSRSLTSIDASQYELIEATMSESARGRWFLQEYARRNRNADTEMLLGAIERLEGAVTAERSAVSEPDRVGRMRVDLVDMANAIARTKAEIAAISVPDADQSRLGVASLALDAIVLATERATSDILGAAEHVQEAAWTLRESGSDTGICDELDRMATQIYTACSFQDLTAQRTARIIHTLRYLEDRLRAMMEIWGDEIAEVPAQEHRATAGIAPEELCQTDVDRFIDMDNPAPPPAAAAARRTLPDVPGLDDDVTFVETAAPTGWAQEEVSETEENARGSTDLAGGLDMREAQDASMAGEEPLASGFDAVPASPWDSRADERQESEAPAPVSEPAGDAPVGKTARTRKATPARKTSPARKMEPPHQTDVEAAFADIDGLTPEEKAALFS